MVQFVLSLLIIQGQTTKMTFAEFDHSPTDKLRFSNGTLVIVLFSGEMFWFSAQNMSGYFRIFQDISEYSRIFQDYFHQEFSEVWLEGCMGLMRKNGAVLHSNSQILKFAKNAQISYFEGALLNLNI